MKDFLKHVSSSRTLVAHLGLLCCLHVFNPFLVLSSCSAFRPQLCQ